MTFLIKTLRSFNAGLVLILLVFVYFIGIGSSRIIFSFFKRKESSDSFWVKASNKDDVRYESAY